MSEFGLPERVYVEIEYYDGPRAGIADVGGLPHRFVSPREEWMKDDLGIYFLWPIDDATLILELEQWRIFVEWDIRYLDGSESADTHPSYVDQGSRWAELDEVLKESRSRVPASAKKALAQFPSLKKAHRYEADGPSYSAQWRLLEERIIHGMAPGSCI